MADIARPNVLYHGVPFYIVLNGSVTVGDPIAENGTDWVQADADAPIPCQAFALATGASGDVIPACTQYVGQTTTDLTIGGPVYLSATAGRIADANVGGNATITQVIGWVVRGATTETVLLDAKIPHYEIATALAGATPATAANFGQFYVAQRPKRLVSAVERHRTAGGDASAVTLTLEKLTSGTAEASGVNMLSTTFDLKSTADTPVRLGPSSTVADTRLAPRNAMALQDTGTLTSCAQMCLTVTLVDDIQ